MTIGIGTDIVEIARIRTMVEKYGAQFLERVFTPVEIAYCSAKADSSISFSARWAAKEAFYKALPPKIQPLGTWHAIEVVNDAAGRPTVTILSDSLEKALVEVGMQRVLLTLSHEKSHSVAFCLIE